MNYTGAFRSNYFRVNDTQAFREWLSGFGNLALISGDDGTVGFYDEDGYGKPTSRTTDDFADEGVEFEAELATFLPEGEVAILVEAGHEGARYCYGFANAVTRDGIVAYVNLVPEIMARVENLGLTATAPEY